MNCFKFRLIIVAVLILTACSGNNDSLSPRGNVIGGPIEKGSQTVAQLDATTAVTGLRTLTGTAKCDVKVMQINYQTLGVQPGEMTNASAAVLIPSGTDPSCQGPLPLIAFGRGTNLEKSHTIAKNLRKCV